MSEFVEAVEALLAVLEDDLLTLALLAVQWLYADSLNDILPQHLCADLDGLLTRGSR